MFDLIAKVLAWFYELWPSFGMSIVLLTLVVMVILTPLTLYLLLLIRVKQILTPVSHRMLARSRHPKS